MKKNRKRVTIETLEYILMYVGFVAMMTMIIFNLINNPI